MQTIFVFGSNLAGVHGAGSAKEAASKWGAEFGIGMGRTGNAYAIATKDHRLKVLSLESIECQVRTFLAYARENPELTFNIVDIGCGLAGYKAEQIAPFFKGAPENCNFLGHFKTILES